MFSARTNWPRKPNRLTELVEEFRSNGRMFLDLTISNPTECGFTYPSREILSALGQPESLRYEPSPKGLPSAREAVASYYRQKGIDVNTSDIILTASTSEAYSMAFKLLCGPGDEVLVPIPSYPLFEFLTQLNDVVTRPYFVRYDGEWHIDMNSLRQSISSRTKAIVLVSPHNPTGMFLKKSDLAALSSIAAEFGLALVIDEVFADYGFGDDISRVSYTVDNAEVLTFTLNGISKLAGLPQMKLGWMVVSGPTQQKGEALARLEIIADTYLSVNTPVQVALPQLFRFAEEVRRSIRGRIMKNRTVLQQSLGSDSMCTLLNCEGGWYAVLRVPRTKSDEQWAFDLMQDVGVFVHPGYFYEFEEDNVLVISLLALPSTFRDGVNKLLDYVHNH